MSHVELSRRAERDLHQIQRAGELPRIKAAIAGLGSDAKQLDIVMLQGRSPWRRLRDGNWRILFRPLSSDEMRELGHRGGGYLVGRIVNRRELDRAIESL